jgi:hypothetical protein
VIKLTDMKIAARCPGCRQMTEEPIGAAET